ncbi:MAG: NAD(P)H-hydrate dehydratase [Deltaproteobacteria bacterium]|nr:NAD(P)H-hydrate dehydratase [Deltaproteobacteria bacterium]
MIPLLTRDEVRALDAHAIEKLGVPGVVLMENAGRGAADALLAVRPRPGRVDVVAGTGNNGGDGYVLARHLRLRGHDVRVLALGVPRDGSDAAIMRAVAAASGIAILDVPPLSVAGQVADASVVVDAVLGTGLDRLVGGATEQALRAIDASPAFRVALDLPSGLDADTGQPLGFAPRADLTITFAAHKRGLHAPPGAVLAGRVVLADIGVKIARGSAGILEASDVAAWFPERDLDAHKASVGRVLVVAGCPGTSGAAALSGLGALRTGAGLVTVASRADLEGRVLELMARRITDTSSDVDRVLAWTGATDAVAVGPGLGTDEGGRRVARRVALETTRPAVLDADALTAFAADAAVLRGAAGPRVVTPHPGEAARLLGNAPTDVARDRFGAARRLADLTGSVAVLKGARTIVCAPDGRTAVCARGTPALATAGSGDVLTGVVAALLALADDPFEAAAAAVELHARAGEIAGFGVDRGVLAGDVAAAIPRAWAQTREQAAGRVATS